jgi:uncharacterized membrane protein YebE (DUF533 family)
MGFGRLVGSLLGGFGGRALGAALGGNTGAMIGSLAGSLLGSQGAGGLSGLFKQNQNQNQQQQQQGGVSRAALADSSVAAAAVSGGTAVNPEIDEVKAEILVKAMCSAAKSDGNVDETEIKAIIGRLNDSGGVDAEEKALLERELSGPVDLPALLASVPKGFEAEVYAASLMAIDSVSGSEATYLSQLSTGLGLSIADVAQIKEAVGV